MNPHPRALERTLTTGTGDITLLGADLACVTLLSAAGDGGVLWYAMYHQTANEWEEGRGKVVSGSPATLQRVAVWQSSNGDARVNFSAGSKLVFITDSSLTVQCAQQLKRTVRAAAMTNVSLSSGAHHGSSLGGVTLAANDLVLLAGQTTGSENGLYQIKESGAPDRCHELIAGDAACGMIVFVREGTAAGTAFVCSNAADADVVGTDDLVFEHLGANDTSGLVHADGSVAFAADQSLGSHRLTNVATPTTSTDAATKGYVDAVAAGLDWKASVRVATTVNITLSGAQTIDGVSVIAGDRVLVKNQSTGSQNGIYVVAAGSWSRAADADVSAEVTSGLCVTVTEGTANGNKVWALTTDDPITLGTTSLSFSQIGIGTGDVVGPSSATDNALCRYDGTTGKLIQNSGVTLDDNHKLAHKAAYQDIITVSDGSTITVDANLGNKFRVTVGGSRTLAFTNLAVGQMVCLLVKQGGGGSNTLTYPAGVYWPSDEAPSLSTAVGDTDMMGFWKTDSTPVILGVMLAKGFTA